MKRVKISDIAKEAGVSCATVSYVLNNNPKQKINDTTKKKILQIASLLGYTKNVYASALASGKSNHIGIYIGDYDFPLFNAELFSFIKELISSLKLNGYDAILLSNAYNQSVDFVDAIICISLSEDDFRIICNNVLIPVIAVDTKAHEDWIFGVSTLYEHVKEQLSLDNYIFVTYKQQSAFVNRKIQENNSNTLLVSNYFQLNNLDKNFHDSKIVAGGNEIYNYMKAIGVDSIEYRVNNTIKINKIIEYLKFAIDRVKTDNHLFTL